jgi:hypothetical protein
MNFVENFKSAQFGILFRRHQSILMQNLRIFGALEGIHFEFTILSWFQKICIIIKPRGPQLSAAV